ncbi:MAG: hypothetical protein ACPHIC_02305 [Acidimicrobiales bacterium]
MVDLLVVVFWIWTAVSILIFVRRRFTSDPLRADQAPHEMQPLSSSNRADRIAAFEAKLATQEIPGDTPAADPLESRSPPVEPDASDDPQAVTLAQALAGITMPADLSPLVADDIDPRQLLCLTTTASPEVVTETLAAELERLGFVLSLPDEHSIAATRRDATVLVQIMGSAEAIRAVLGARLATVPDDAVVATFQLR